jgi:ATP-dependent RNA helicase DDX56/DBP9
MKIGAIKLQIISLNYRMEELDGFKYRAKDAWRAVTRIAVREARLKEIRQEILNSTKLQAHLADNPKDAKVLRHDKALHTVRHQAQLKNVPDYIVPQSLRKLTNKISASRSKTNNKWNKASAAKRKFDKKQADPLHALVSKGRRRK